MPNHTDWSKWSPEIDEPDQTDLAQEVEDDFIADIERKDRELEVDRRHRREELVTDLRRLFGYGFITFFLLMSLILAIKDTYHGSLTFNEWWKIIGGGAFGYAIKGNSKNGYEDTS